MFHLLLRGLAEQILVVLVFDLFFFFGFGCFCVVFDFDWTLFPPIFSFALQTFDCHYRHDERSIGAKKIIVVAMW